jgi:RNA polymerase sigma-70 factor (ECF subfamily)
MDQSDSAGPRVPLSAQAEFQPGFPLHRERRLTELVAKVAHGDQSALGELYDETSQIVYSLSLRMLSNTADAEEVTLDVYAKAWRAAATYDSRRGTVLAWLVTLTRSRAVDRLRSRVSRERREETGNLPMDAAISSPDPEEQASSDQNRMMVAAAMARLSPEQKESIELAFFGGLTHSEISEQLGLPVGTVKTRIRLGMLKLRDALKIVGPLASRSGGTR